MKRGFTLIEIVIVIAIISVISAISIVSVLRIRMIANESIAKAHTKLIANALESYATANNGVYPTSENYLTSGSIPYLYRNYCGYTISGYIFGCHLTQSGYFVASLPVEYERTGRYDYAASTGGLLITDFEYDDAIVAVLQSPLFWRKATVAAASEESQEDETPPSEEEETPPSEEEEIPPSEEEEILSLPLPTPQPRVTGRVSIDLPTSSTGY